MKSVLLILSALTSLSAFANPNVAETGTWNFSCLVYTTGSHRADVVSLANGKQTLELAADRDVASKMVTVYKEGRREFKVWLSHFTGQNPDMKFNVMEVGLFKNGKFVAGAHSNFDEEPPKSLQMMMPNWTKRKGPPMVGFDCRREK